MSLTPIFDAVLADSDPDIFLAGLIFPRPTVFATGGLIPALARIGHPSVADWVREGLGIEVLPWQREFLADRYRAEVRAHFPMADKGHRVLREQAFIWADDAA